MVEAKWVPAQLVPTEWEGREAWHWISGRAVGISRIPMRFSRTYEICKGVWFKLIELPELPSAQEQQEYERDYAP
jgi:hypothetical protein